MKTVMQRVNKCDLSVEGKPYSSIGQGILLTVGVHRDDTMEDVVKTASKLTKMRIYKDENDKLNKSVLDIGGDCMVVSNFTLNAFIASGTRPDFSQSADMEKANTLYLALAEEIKKCGVKNVQTGHFRTHMHISTQLDGPFTIVFDTHERNKKWGEKYENTRNFWHCKKS